jgi:hypothetical protein
MAFLFKAYMSIIIKRPAIEPTVAPKVAPAAAISRPCATITEASMSPTATLNICSIN